MRKFYATGTDQSGKKYAGSFMAESEAEARRLLQLEGYRSISLEDQGPVENQEKSALKKVELTKPKDDDPKNPGGSVKAGGRTSRKPSLMTAFGAGAFILFFLLLVVWGLYIARSKGVIPPEPPMAAMGDGENSPQLVESETTNFNEETLAEDAQTTVDAEYAEVQVIDWK